jgi:hypothetical protein
MNVPTEQENTTGGRQDVAKNIFNRMGTGCCTPYCIDVFVVNFMDMLVEPFGVEQPMTPVEEKVVTKGTKDHLRKKPPNSWHSIFAEVQVNWNTKSIL